MKPADPRDCEHGQSDTEDELEFNYEKIPYRANCYQWNGRNTAEIISLIPRATLHDSDHIIIRHAGGITTMHLNDWVRFGQNKVMKIIPDAKFKQRYRKLTR